MALWAVNFFHETDNEDGMCLTGLSMGGGTVHGEWRQITPDGLRR